MATKVDARLLSELEDGDTPGFWLLLHGSPDLSAAHRMDWDERGHYVFQQLQSAAARAQAGVTEHLLRSNVDYESFWITNAIYVPQGDLNLVAGLAQISSVAEIVADGANYLIEPVVEGLDDYGAAAGEALEPAPQDGPEWGISDIGADKVWQEYGVDGSGIVIGSIDSGVMYDHEALVASYRGNLGGGEFEHDYNWYDPSESCDSDEPCDENGHGTHTAGTMVGYDGGANRIGVAPGARWIAARGCESRTCSDFALLKSMEFMLAPTDRDGENPDPGQRPHIVNNSWGSSRVDGRFESAVQAWAAAGIFPVFANGNDGPRCGTVGQPALFPDGYGVGNYTSAHTINETSSRGPGPATHPGVKPDISAPGTVVRSAWNNGGYASATGTSMAAPHVAGAVALLWSAGDLTGNIDETRGLLADTAIPVVDMQCGGEPEFNNVWGHGRLDVHAAMDAIGETGTLTGVVTAAAIDSGAGSMTSAPGAEGLEGVKVTAVNEETGTIRNAYTSADGTYEMNLPAGAYDVEFSLFGYESESHPGIEVSIDEETELSASLTPMQKFTVSGVVASSRDDEPIRASITVTGVPVDPVETDPDTGEYSIDLPAGDYTLVARAPQHLDEQVEIQLDGDTEENFLLEYFETNVLLVDDRNIHRFDSLAIYEGALEELGIPYEVFTVPNRGDGPERDYMEGFDVVVWFSGGTIPGAGPNAKDEGELAAYLEGGGSLFLSSQDYLWHRSLNHFSENYLGLEDYTNRTKSTQITGVEGHAVGGSFTEPAELEFPTGFSNWSDNITAAAHGKTAFTGDAAPDGIAVTVDGIVYRTAFLAFPWELITDEDVRTAIMGEFLSWLNSKPVGTAEGTITDGDTGLPLSHVEVSATDTATGRRYSAVTDDNGRFTRTLPEGTFDFTFTRYGYADKTVTGIETSPGEVTIVDHSMDPLSAGTVSGIIVDGTGSPVAAQVSVKGAMVEPVESDPETGAYEIQVAYGSYTIEAVADGFMPARKPVEVASATVELDFMMQELNPNILLVDDRGGASYDSGARYTEAFDALGVEYDTFVIPYQGEGPTADHMADYDVVVWFTGASFLSGVVGPGPEDEEELQAYLDNGGSLLLSSGNYLSHRDPTDFRETYLGAGDHEDDTRSTQVQGVAGHPIGDLLLEPLELVFPTGFPNNNDSVTASETGETAMVGDLAPEGIAITVEDAGYKTALFAFPWEAIDGVDERISVMLELLSWLHYKPATGLITGQVTDDNDGEPIANAAVTAVHDGVPVRRVFTGSDGMYELRAPLGQLTVEVSALNYDPDSAAVELENEGDQVSADFSLVTGLAEVEPDSLEFQVPRGGMTTADLILSNSGGRSVAWEITAWADPNPLPDTGTDGEGRGGHPFYGLVGTAYENPGASVHHGQRLQTKDYTAEELYEEAGIPEPAFSPAEAGDIIKSWPTHLSTPWGVGYDGDVYISNPYERNRGGDEFNYRFTVDGGFISRWTTAAWHGDWAADITYDSRHDLLWQVAVGGDNCIYGMVPDSGSVLRTICGAPWNYTSQRGVAYRADTDTFYIGGWNDNVIYHIKGLSWDNPGEVLEQHDYSPGGRAIAGLAWNGGARVLWVATNSSDDNMYALMPDAGWLEIATVGHPDPGYNGAGLSTDEDGNLWLTSIDGGDAYLIDSGIPAFPEESWLSAEPAEGTVDPDASGDIVITVDAADLETGTYAANLQIQTDSGRNPLLTVPVTLEVIDEAEEPELHLTEPEEGTHTNDDTITVAGTAIDPAGGDVTVTVNGEGADVEADGSFEIRILLPEAEGPFEITAVATSDSGGTAEETRTVIVDRTAPSIDDVMPDEDVELEWGDELTISFTSESGLEASYQILVAGTGHEGLPGVRMEEVGDTGVYEGTYTAPDGAAFTGAEVEVYAMDKAGNIAQLTAAGTITVVGPEEPEPVEPPALVITEPGDGFLTNRDAVRVSGAATDDQDGQEVEKVTVNGREVAVEADGSFSTRIILWEGDNVITVTATNTAGETATESVTVVADWTAPELTNLEPAEDITLEQGDTYTFRFVSEPGLEAAYQIVVGGSHGTWITRDIPVKGTPMMETAPGSGVYEATYTAPEGMLLENAIVQFNAADPAGNVIMTTAPGELTVVEAD